MLRNKKGSQIAATAVDIEESKNKLILKKLQKSTLSCVKISTKIMTILI
ncbi:hypothetical protein [Wolbachia endosymbiont (group B) of Camptogramma bilineatum]|nr:hypothetical protein [Wolbachia endosymbiont (group B) of Camptogramma bilineatum]